MRSNLAAFLLLLAAACGGSSKSTATVYQAGFANDETGRELPVLWKGEDDPTRLPLLSYTGDCPPAGRALALAANGADVHVVGFSALCIDGNENMKPALWQGGTVTQLAFAEPTSILGLATGIAFKDGVTYIVGAEGTQGPLPILWVDGYPVPIPLPDGVQFLEPQRIVATADALYVSAVGTEAGTPGSLPWVAGVWKITGLDAEPEWTELPALEGAEGKASMPVAVAVDGADVWAGANWYAADASSAKPALHRSGGAASPLIDADFSSEPYGYVTGVASTAGTPVASGWVGLSEQFGYPGPVFWKDGATTKLSTADATVGIGIAYDVAVVGSDTYVTGFTSKLDPGEARRLIDVPAYWVNGVRHDRQGLSTSGTAVAPATSVRWPSWGAQASRAGFGSAFTVNASQSAVATAIAVVE